MKLDFDPRKNITALDYVIRATLDYVIGSKSLQNKAHDFLVIRSIVKNWRDVLLFRLGIKKEKFIVKFKNGLEVKINKPNDYFDFWSTSEGQEFLLQARNPDTKIKVYKKNKLIKFKYGNKIIGFYFDSARQRSNTIQLISEEFIIEQYKWLNLKNKQVIDIGANICDSAIYFALKGARHIYAFEPYPYSYELAQKNIKLNGLRSKITLLNEGVGGKTSGIRIGSEYKNYGGSDLKNFSSGKSIQITTLEDIVKRFNIENASLKIDCEGCEYGVILNSPNKILRKFDQIVIEYHYGYKNLKAKLENAGFTVRNTQPSFYLNPNSEYPNTIMGFIYATLNES